MYTDTNTKLLVYENFGNQRLMLFLYFNKRNGRCTSEVISSLEPIGNTKKIIEGAGSPKDIKFIN